MTSLNRVATKLYVAAAIVFLLLPILVVIPSAFGESSELEFPPTGFSFRWFENVFEQPDFLQGFVLSVRLAITATTISLLFGGAAAYALSRYSFPGKRLVSLAFTAPLAFPAIVLAVALAVGLSFFPVFGRFGNLLLAHIIVTLPYAIRTLTAAFSEFDVGLEEAASTLGAGRLATIWYVILPLIRPGLASAATFCLITSFDEFTISLFLTKPGYVTLPIAMYAYTDYNLDPTIAAISTLLLLVPAIIFLFGVRLMRTSRQVP